MRKSILTVAVAASLACLVAAVAVAGEAAPASVKQLAVDTLAPLGNDPVIVAAVKAANAEGKTLEQIQARDTEWQRTPGITDDMRALMESACGQKLRELQDAMPYISEIFVMDNQGANVAMTDKTSDYWQGDEAKFVESFASGKGAVHVGDVEFDESSQAYTAQVSVPVRDGDAAIGAITFGIDVDRIAELGI